MEKFNTIFTKPLFQKALMIAFMLLFFSMGSAFAQSSDINVNKAEVSDDTPNPLQSITFLVELENKGPNGATGLAISAVLQTGLTYVSHTITSGFGTYNSGTGIWTIGTMPKSGTKPQLVITATVNAGASGSTIPFTAFVSALTTTDPVSANNSKSVNVVVNGPDLTVTKEVDDNTPSVGQTIEYTIKVKNNGTASGTNIQITDLLPSGVTYTTTTTNDGISYTPGTGIWVVGTLTTGTEYELIIEATVNAGVSGATITNTASVTAMTQNDQNPADNTASVNILVDGPDLTVTKSVNDNTPDVGQVVTFTVKVKNNGSASGTSIVVTDNLPAGLTLSGTPTVTQGTFSGGVWTLGTLATGQERILTISATVNAGTASTTITNTATVTGMTQNDQNPADNTGSANVVVNGPDLTVTKSVDDNTPNEFQIIEYEIIVKNNGEGPGTNIVITDLLPAGITYVSTITIEQGTYTPGTGAWAIGTLAKGVQKKLVIEATVNNGTAGTTITNTAALTSMTQNDLNAGDNTASAAITVNTCASPPTITITPNVSTCSTAVATFSYTVANGPTTSFTHTGQGTLSLSQLPNGSGTFTYTPSAFDLGKVVTITAFIPDPDGAGAIGPCKSATKTATFTSFVPDLGGPDNVFMGSTVNLLPNTAGTWISNNTGVATITNAGVVTPVAPGTTTFTYTQTALSCAATTGTFTVYALPPAAAVTKQLYLTPTLDLTRTVPTGGSASSTAGINGTVASSGDFEDLFEVISYSNNNGSNNWIGDWLEVGDDNDPGGGEFKMEVDLGNGKSYLIIKDAETGDYLARGLNLDAVSTVALNTNFILNVLDPGESILLQISPDGNAANYVTVGTLTNGTSTGFKSYDVTSIIPAANLTSNAKFRFYVVGNADGKAKETRFDDVNISYTIANGNNSETFTQGTAMCADLVLPAGGGIWITAFATVTDGAMPVGPDVDAILRYGATTLATLSNPDWDGTKFTWTTALGSAVTIPAGEAISLECYSYESKVTFTVDYGSTGAASEIALSTTSYINIDNLAVYDAAYSGGSVITTIEATNPAYVRAVVSDPFGSTDITGVDLSINAGAPVAATLVNTDAGSCTRTYEYVWTPVSADIGTNSLEATAKEGTEGTVTDTESINFDVEPNGELTITKTLTTPVSAGPYAIGTTLVYTISIENTGGIDVASIPLADTFDDFCLDFVSASTAPTTTGTGTLNWTDLGALAQTNTLNLTVTFTVANECASTVNTATITGALDTNGDPVPSSTDDETISTVENPVIGLAKNLTSVVDNLNGTYTITYLLTLENFGDVPLSDLEIFDDIQTIFAAQSPTTFAATSGSLTGNGSWDGSSTSNILAGSQSLAVSATGTVSISFIVTPTDPVSIDNTATANGTSPISAIVSDVSTDGTDPDGTTTDNTPNENDVTPTFVCGPLTLVATPTDPLCNAGSNGSISLSVTNNIGSPTYTYAWDKTATTGSGSGTSITGLTAGTYEVTLTDNQGCKGTISGITLTDPPALTMEGIATNPTTFGGSDGTINLNITNGTPVYNYAWDNGTTTGSGTGIVISGLEAGSYDITVTDGNACQVMITVVLPDYPCVENTTNINVLKSN